MKYPEYILSATVVSLGAVLGVVYQYDLFGAYLWILTGFALFVPLTLILGVLALGFVLAKRRIGKILSYCLVVSCSCVVSLFVCDMTGSWINRWKIDAVISYVARAIPVLDQMKQKDGYYPSKLPTNLLGDPPEILRNYGDYSATSSTFKFEYVNEPAEWAGGEGAIEFDSGARKWMNDR